MTRPDPAGADAEGRRPAGGFEVHLENFSGPFDLLLSLIARHRLDVTEVALARVTDEFVARVRALGPAWDLDETSEFLLVAATLLDLKAARLLPQGRPEDPEDLALLEARDLLFARLLQYRAYRQVASAFEARLAEAGRRVPRAVPLEPHLATLLPELVMAVTPERLAQVAGRALAPRVQPAVATGHLHAPAVSVPEQAAVLVDRLRRLGTATFRHLAADAGSTLVVVARFLAVLDLYRDGRVAVEQVTPLGELTVRWTGQAREVAADGDPAAGSAAPVRVAARAPVAAGSTA